MDAQCCIAHVLYVNLVDTLAPTGAVVALFVAVAIGYEASSWEPNYFTVLNLTRTATPRDVRMAWKDMSKKLHPDVNNSPDAEAVFVKLAKIKDVLTSPSDRKVYVRIVWWILLLMHH